MKDTPIQDLRDRSKEEAMHRLHQAEWTYLLSRGWTGVCGVPHKYCVSPEDLAAKKFDNLYSHEEALKIQKERDSRSS